MFQENHALTTQLSTYHDIRAIGIIRAFVAQTGQFFGANETEVHQLKLASEEAAGFIINALIPDKKENFNIVCESIDQGLRFYFENKGIPIDEENMPVYDSTNPTDSLDALPFFLIENVTDAVKFKNKGNDGWVLVFEKRFKKFQSLQVMNEIDPEVLDRCAKEKLPITMATAEDAYDLIKLTYFTYRYSYVKQIFYYRKELENAVTDGNIIAFIGKNTKNEVVINSAFFRSPHCDAIAESGMLMSQPEYRRNRALLRLTRLQLEYIKEGDSGIRVLYSKLVTAHTKSQRLLAAYHFLPTSLKLSIHDQADFVGLDTQEVGRESLLYALLAPNGFEPTTLYVPQKHQKITEQLLESIDVIDISTETDAVHAANTSGTVDTEEEDRIATINIEKLGKDWFKWLRDHLNACDNNGIITIHLHIPADQPLPKDLESKLHSQKLFYSGIVIKTMQRWELVYTLLQGQHFDFDSVALYEETAMTLHEYMKQEYLTLKES